jgi:predicted oxidoreductase
MSLSRVKLSPDGPEISRLVFGAWRLADRPETNSPAAVEERIRAALEVGITTFDHADIYGNYTVEDLFGRALARSPDLKKKIEIVTKTGIRLVSGNRPSHRIKSYDTSRRHIEESVDHSLTLLGVEKIDCLLLHRPDYLADPEEIAATFEDLYKKGKVLSFGVSNHSVSQVELLRSAACAPFVANQIEFSLFCTDPLDNGVLDQCRKTGLIPMAWSPLGGGRLFHDSSLETQRLVRCLHDIVARRTRSDLAIEHVALAWLLAHPARVIPVLGTSNLARISAVVRAEDVMLTREEWYEVLQAAKGCEVP